MAFINVYKSGYYHRMGKPNQFNCHPGDLYPTHAAAFADVDPAAAHLFLGTFFVAIPWDVLGQVNAEDSVPVPLSVSKRQLRLLSHPDGVLRDPSGLPSEVVLPHGWPEHIVGMRPLTKAIQDWPMDGSLETPEADAVYVEPPNVVAWRRAQEARRKFSEDDFDMTLGAYSRYGAGEEGR